MSGRSTPRLNGTSTSSAKQQRNSQNLSHIRHLALTDDGRPPSRSHHVLASLRATTIAATSKPVLPAELLATILDYLPVPDLLRFARVSRRLQEMVYDDTRWIQKLNAMGAWNEAEARQRFEEVARRRMEAQQQRAKEGVGVHGPGGGGGGVKPRLGSVTLFDAGVEEGKSRRSEEQVQRTPTTAERKATLTDGFEESHVGLPASPAVKALDLNAALVVFKNVQSIRGRARQEFAKVYAALAPIYLDLVKSSSHSDAIIFRTYREPEPQAQVLANLKRFVACDTAFDCQERERRLEDMITVFSKAVVREFEHGYAAGDVDGRMRRYAHVLCTLGLSDKAVEAYITSHPIISRTMRAGNPLDCLEAVAPGHVDLNPSQRFFERLAGVMVEQAGIIDRVFPPTVDVLTPFLSQVCNGVVDDYLTALFDEAHNNASMETYCKAVSGTFEQALRLVASLQPISASPPDFRDKAKDMIVTCYEKHVDLYLAEELALFKSKAEGDVTYWEKEQSEQEASTESFFMSNINRQAAKRDFLSSFKKVVMMPVNVLPAFPLSSPFASTQQPQKSVTANLTTEEASSRPRTPTLNDSGTPARSTTPAQEAPTTELAAKAAIMSSRLEGIKSLFSIEVALNLTHLAKASIERAAIINRMGGKPGQDAKEQCERIFVQLLYILGDRHIRAGFDKAVGHLGNYNPKEVREFRAKVTNGEEDVGRTISVEPLVTFLELVNVGDLIQQMIDVFYNQEIVGTKLVDRDDFLSAAVKQKKKFEQMLDERVAAGLNKGIDVLMDEVEYICASTQVATDFNPGADKEKSASTSAGMIDIGPTPTARQVVDMVQSHTSMLVGSTDKNMLDVFMQEIGLRLFGVLCKHFKRQRISVDGAIKLISDINHYSAFITTLRQKPLLPYFQALRELGAIFLVHIDPPTGNFLNPGKRGSWVGGGKASKTQAQAKELATIIADGQRYCGIFPAEEVYEFAQRRADWFVVKGEVERGMYGQGCEVM